MSPRVCRFAFNLCFPYTEAGFEARRAAGRAGPAALRFTAVTGLQRTHYIRYWKHTGLAPPTLTARILSMVRVYLGPAGGISPLQRNKKGISIC